MNSYKQYKPRREFGVILLIECLFTGSSFYKVADVHHDYHCHHRRYLNKQCYQAPASIQEEALGHWTQSLEESVKDLVGPRVWPFGQVLVASGQVEMLISLFIIWQTMPHHSFIHLFHK